MGEAICILPSHFFLFMLIILSSYEKVYSKKGLLLRGLNCSCVVVVYRCKPDVETYNALINAHGRAGQWRWALNIMDDMLRAAVCTLHFPSLVIFCEFNLM